jgi:amidase
MHELLKMTALELAAAIRQREISSEEACRFYLSRIEQLDGGYSAFVSVLEASALRAARGKDQKSRSTPADELPIFHGVPLGLKDLALMRGTRTQLGSRAFRYFRAPIDAPVTKLLKRGGFVVLGKTATSEFGALPVTEPLIHAPTRNPWNSEHTPGGSSGGSGAAVAAELVPLAHGSDGGGSVRIPAAFCHLYGFKPTHSLLGNLHGRVNTLALSTMGPLTHDVADAAAMLDVMRGHPMTHRHYAQDSCLTQQALPTLRSLKIRFCTEAMIGHVEPEIAAAVESAAHILEGFGHRVEQVPMVQGRLEDFLPLWQRMLANVPSISESVLQPVTRWLRQVGRGLDHAETQRLKQVLLQRVLEFHGDADVLLTPTVGQYAPKVGAFAGLEPEAAFIAISALGSFTAPFNVTGQPAASIPAGVSDSRLPYGVQIVGRQGRDDVVLRLSRQLEEAMPWRERSRQWNQLPR